MLGYDGQLFGELKIQKYSEETRHHLALVYDGCGAIGEWRASELPAGQKLREPAPLFTKLDPEIVEQERGNLGPGAGGETAKLSTVILSGKDLRDFAMPTQKIR